jgi:hypothetical protein
MPKLWWSKESDETAIGFHQQHLGQTSTILIRHGRPRDRLDRPTAITSALIVAP